MLKSVILHGLVIIVIIVLALSPFIPVEIASRTARQHGCQLDEGSIHPCIVDGEDIGKDLYTMGMMGWLGMVTIPAGVILILVYLLLVIGFYTIRWIVRRQRASSPNPLS